MPLSALRGGLSGLSCLSGSRPGADSHVAGANDVGRVEEDAAGATDILPGRAVKSDQQKTQHGDRVAIFKWCFLTNYTDISDISSDLIGMLWTLQ